MNLKLESTLLFSSHRQTFSYYEITRIVRNAVFCIIFFAPGSFFSLLAQFYINLQNFLIVGISPYLTVGTFSDRSPMIDQLIPRLHSEQRDKFATAVLPPPVQCAGRLHWTLVHSGGPIGSTISPTDHIFSGMPFTLNHLNSLCSCCALSACYYSVSLHTKDTPLVGPGSRLFVCLD